MKKIVLINGILSFITVQTLFCAEHLNKTITLEEAIEVALKSSEKSTISKYDLQIAEVQYKQAMSANFPSLDLEIAAVKRDEDIINITQGQFTLPDSMSSILGGVAREQMEAQVTAEVAKQVTAQATAQGAPLSVEQIAVIQQGVTNQASAQFSTTDLNMIPLNFESKVFGDETVKGSLKMTYPLYTGGKISALQKQAKLGIQIAGEKDKRTKQEIIFDIKKYYHGVLLAKGVARLLDDTSQRMELLNDLTKELYEGGSENVKKTDYYRTQLASSMLKAISTEMNSNAKLAKSALVFAMGIDPKSKLSLQNIKADIATLQSLSYFMQEAYKHNSELVTLTKALEIYDAKVDEANSEYKPNVALFGSLDKVNNNYDGGMSNDQNDNSWTVGVGASWNLFNGFRTSNEVSEAKLNKLKLKEQHNMLKNGLALQVKKAYFDNVSNRKQVEILKNTVQTAADNRDLNTRAYQADMAETKDVVEAQITEAQITAKYLKVLHDKALSSANLDLIIGR